MFNILSTVQCVHEAFLSLCVPLKKDLKFTESLVKQSLEKHGILRLILKMCLTMTHYLQLNTDPWMHSCSKYRKLYF